jgi:hypothetical protein
VTQNVASAALSGVTLHRRFVCAAEGSQGSQLGSCRTVFHCVLLVDASRVSLFLSAKESDFINCYAFT